MSRVDNLTVRMLEDIRRLPPNSLLPSIREMQKKYKISLTTLNQSLEELERKELIRREWGRGIFVCRTHGLAGRQLAVVLPTLSQIYYSQLLDGICAAATRHDKEVVIVVADQQKGQQGLTFPKEVDGAIVMASTFDINDSRYVESVQAFQRSGRRVVMVDVPVPGVPAHCIGFDNRSGLEEATRRLLRRGCRRIAIAARMHSIIATIRVEAVRRAMTDTGASLEVFYYLDNPLIPDTDGSRLTGELHAIVNRITEWNAEGVILEDPNTSYTLARLFQDKGRPEIAGVVEDGCSLPTEGAISIIKPSRALGERAAELLFIGNSEQSGGAEEWQAIFLPLNIAETGHRPG